MTTDEILEQAQVFASAWSLVGSRFDSGDAIDSANNEEERLGQMIDELVKERNAYAKAADEMAAAHKVERDAYIVEAARVDAGWRKANEAALETALENAALKDAARLALDAMLLTEYAIGTRATTQDLIIFERGVVALKAVL